MNKEALRLLKAHQLYCVICGELILRREDYSVEHCPPKSRQWECGPSKTYPSHKKCNADKGSLTMD